jgi:hypothetical protein
MYARAMTIGLRIEVLKNAFSMTPDKNDVAQISYLQS